MRQVKMQATVKRSPAGHIQTTFFNMIGHPNALNKRVV
jgi:hypothetical protein